MAKSKKRKARRNVSRGIAHIKATFNNTIVTITDGEGRTVAWKSSGSLGFRGSRKGTPFAAQQAAMNAANQAREHGMRGKNIVTILPDSGERYLSSALFDSVLD